MPAISLVIMAAGIGSRYGGLKQIDPVGPHGELIIHYSVYDALRAGFDRIVFVIRRNIEAAFRERVGRVVEAQAAVTYVFQELNDLPGRAHAPAGRVKPWGTGHALWCCRKAVDTPFAAINADDFYGATSFQAIASRLREANDQAGQFDFSMVGYPLRNTLSDHGHVARGVCEVALDGALISVQEHTRIQAFADGIKTWHEDTGWTPLAPDIRVSMNFWGFTPALFPELEQRLAAFLREDEASLLRSELYLPTVVGELIQAGRAHVQVLPTHEQWFGVTYQADRAAVQAAMRSFVAQGVYPNRLWE